MLEFVIQILRYVLFYMKIIIVKQTAQEVIKASDRPIAAPSANLFSHVSPTSAIHVFNDLYDKDISIIDGETCSFGIDSTVIKIMELESKLAVFILRIGSVSEKNIRTILDQSEIYKYVEVINAKNEHSIAKDVNAEAPGQLLKHYSPYIETYLFELYEGNQSIKDTLSLEKETTILIDFGEMTKRYADKFLAYLSLRQLLL